jgi:2-dehydro-3-deoxyphosphogluconate aldolase / (4S)-4-hydroxy-2-oxoglutarate aldolase
MNPITVLQKTGVLPLVSFNEIDRVAPLCQVLISSGINCIEIVYRSQLATRAISIAAKQSGMFAGAGSVMSLDQAVEAVEAGASFVISPGFNPDVVSYCDEKQVLVIPGVCTPTEIMTAMSFGLKTLKFFPAEAMGGIKTLEAFGGPFPEIQWMPAGGIHTDNFMDYLSLPQVLCCSGSWMLRSDLIESQNFEKIKESCQQVVQIINSESCVPVKR